MIPCGPGATSRSFKATITAMGVGNICGRAIRMAAISHTSRKSRTEIMRNGRVDSPLLLLYVYNFIDECIDIGHIGRSNYGFDGPRFTQRYYLFDKPFHIILI